MRTVVATALVLLLTLFLCPMIFLSSSPTLRPAETPLPTATLPIDRTVSSPAATRPPWSG